MISEWFRSAAISAFFPARRRPLRWLALLASLSFWLGGLLHAEEGESGPPQPPLPTATLEIGSARVTAELARTPAQLEAGLMFRPHMDDNAGMLFMLGPEQRATFWMKNTILPLSVAYIERSGAIAEIHDMAPFDTTPVVSRSDKIMYALEMNQGWFALNKIDPGTVIHPSAGRFGQPPFTPTAP